MMTLAPPEPRKFGPKPRGNKLWQTVALLSTAAMAAVGCGSHTTNSKTSASVRDFDGEGGMELGVGYHGILEEVRGKCVTGGLPTTLGGGATGYAQMRLIESTQELTKALNISSASQIKANIPETAVNVSAKTKFLFDGSIAVNRYSVFLLVSTTIKNPTMHLDKPEFVFSTDISPTTDPEGYLNAMRLQCGDEFLSGYTTGGEFHGVIEIETASNEQKAQLAAEASTGVGVEPLGEVTNESKIEGTLRRITSGRKVRVWSFQRGGDLDGPLLFMNVDEMLERAKALPSQVKGDGAAVLTATFKDYGTLNLDLPLSYVRELRAAKQFVGKLSSRQAQLFDAKANIDYILANPNSFEGMTGDMLTRLDTARSEVRRRIEMVWERADACFADMTECREVEDLSVPPYDDPRRVSVRGAYGKGVAIFIQPQVIRANRIKDWWSAPECYVRVSARIGSAKLTVAQTPIYDNCDIPKMTLETTDARLQSAFQQLGGKAAEGIIEISVYEADASFDDYVGGVAVWYRDVQSRHVYKTGISNDNIVIDTTLQITHL